MNTSPVNYQLRDGGLSATWKIPSISISATDLVVTSPNHVNPDRKIHLETSSFSFMFNSYTPGRVPAPASPTALWILEALHPFPSINFAPETLVESLLVESGGHFREAIHHNPPQSTHWRHTISSTPLYIVHPEPMAFGDSKLLFESQLVESKWT